MGAHFCQKTVEVAAEDKMDSQSVRGSMSLSQTMTASIQQDAEKRDTSLASVDTNKQTISQYLTQEK